MLMTIEQREALLQPFLELVPRAPDVIELSFDEYINIRWKFANRVFDMEIAPKLALGDWYAWKREVGGSPEIIIRTQNIDISQRDTWTPLFDALQQEVE